MPSGKHQLKVNLGLLILTHCSSTGIDNTTLTKTSLINLQTSYYFNKNVISNCYKWHLANSDKCHERNGSVAKLIFISVSPKLDNTQNSQLSTSVENLEIIGQVFPEIWPIMCIFYSFFVAVTLTFSSRSRKIDNVRTRCQAHIFSKFEDNQPSGLGGVR